MLRAVRVSLVVQAVGLVGLLATALPSFVDRVTRPPLDCAPGETCFDPTGVAFVFYTFVLVPVIAVLVVTAWLWQTDKKWPAVVPIAIDLLLLRGGMSDLLSPRQAELSLPPAAELTLLVFPALVSLGLVLTFVGLSVWHRMSVRTGDSAGAQGTLS